MCSVLCGPVPEQPSRRERLRPLDIDPEPVDELGILLLDIYDRHPHVQAAMAEYLEREDSE